MRTITLILSAVLGCVAFLSTASRADESRKNAPELARRLKRVAGEFQFDFSSGNTQPNHTPVTSQTIYDTKRGFGFLRGEAATPDQPSVFAVDMDEGNYEVTIRFGDAAVATSTTIKAESRRLMVERVETPPGQLETRTFTVNVRKPAISTGGTTSLNSRELGPPATPDWDDHLTFEFNGQRPGVASIEIKPARDAITVFLAGDSTVTDQRHEPSVRPQRSERQACRRRPLHDLQGEPQAIRCRGPQQGRSSGIGDADGKSTLRQGRQAGHDAGRLRNRRATSRHRGKRAGD